ncbi:hypothetical protein NQZ68_031056 [Dissostichus eleginoides]|nr:hypothetical protein NQZ68_031056 [Dissostichus eleginoides]
MDAELRGLLIKRNISEEFIQKLENEKIDASVIRVMTDADLAKYIPKAGDRIATVAFCRHNNSSLDTKSRKDTMLTRLRQRLVSGEAPVPAKRKPWAGNTSAKKQERRVELGWMDFDGKQKRYKQVKAFNGGGTRHLIISKDKTLVEIKEMAENLFFPDGFSKGKTKLSYYSTEIESSQVQVSSSSTVDNLYEESRVKILRLYLRTKIRKVELSSDEEEAEMQLTSTPVVDLTGSEPHYSTDVQGIDDMVHQEIDPEIIIGAMANDGVQLDDTLPWNDQPPHGLGDPQPAPWNDQPPHGFGEPQPALVTEPWNDQTMDEPAPVTLIIRRGHCLTDLIKAFTNPDILNTEVFIKMRLPNGKLEEGEGSGVTRDCLTEFWTDFYERCTLGGNVKVPFIRHDYQSEEWQAIARILVVGWRIARYFPVKLAVPFLEEALYATSTSSLKDTFLQYVSEQEREVLVKALEDFNSVDTDALFDALEAHECQQVPTKDNLIPLLSQMGHKALIQAPMYVIKCWRPIVVHLASVLPQDALNDVIQQKTPTGKAVKELLQFPDEMTPPQTAVARYLKRYVGEVDLSTLQLFLRFCTGSNLMEQTIKIQFIETSNFERRPQSHTCGCLLKLPVGYHNYPDLRSDFNSVLTSSVWVMDII